MSFQQPFEGSAADEITVLVGTSVHPVSGRPTRSRADATAVTLALSLARPMRLLAAGEMPEAVARDYLALGAPRIQLLQTGPDADIAAALAPALRQARWILTGTRGESEQASGLLPLRLGALLGRPVVTDVLAIEPDGDRWVVTQALPKGARRRLRVSAPAVLAISAAAPVTLRHALADAMSGRIERGTAAGASSRPAAGQRVPRAKRRKLLEARIVQSGHARMLGAIDSPTSGGTVLRSGTAQAKAQAVLDYLRAHSLVRF